MEQHAIEHSSCRKMYKVVKVDVFLIEHFSATVSSLTAY